MLTECEFATLVALKDHGYTSQRKIAAQTGHSLGATNQALASLKDQELIDAAGVTERGLAQLERIASKTNHHGGRFSSRLAQSHTQIQRERWL